MIAALKIFGRVRVQTPAACMTGKCLIHCTMSLRLNLSHCNNVSRNKVTLPLGTFSIAKQEFLPGPASNELVHEMPEKFEQRRRL